MSLQFPSIYAISSDSITRYYEYPERGKKLLQSQKSLANLDAVKHTGSISYNTRKMLRKKLQAYFDCMYDVGAYYRKKYNILHTIVTLTLCAPQSHSDNEIKKECLAKWLGLAVAKYSIRFYYWIAERQKNNNIHFHVLCDRFLDHTWVRKSWNARLDKLGYVAEFAKEHGHSSPNSTDIQAIRSLANSSKYVTKYTTKIEQQSDLEGRLWGCSDSFRAFDKMKVYGSHMYDLKFSEWIDKQAVRVFEHEHCVAMFGRVRELLKAECPNLYKQLRAFYLLQANQLYAVDTTTIATTGA
jgi:hypothetical protein